jgi:hypothetical protein
MQRITTWAAALAGFITFTAQESRACKVIDPNHTIVKKVQDHGATFHGTVVSSEMGPTCGGTARVISLKVIRAFGPATAAAPGDTVSVFSSSSEAMCGVNYAVGTEVVIFSDRAANCVSPGPTLSTNQADFNQANPSKAQLDSLYQSPTSLHPRSMKSAKANPSQIQGVTGFVHPGKPTTGLHRGDGRFVLP